MKQQTCIRRRSRFQRDHNPVFFLQEIFPARADVAERRERRALPGHVEYRSNSVIYIQTKHFFERFTLL